MDESVIREFERLQAEKAAAKGVVMESLGNARLAELRETDPEKFAALPASARQQASQPSGTYWGQVAEHGIHGVEGERLKEMQALADSAYTEHPEWFSHLEGKTQEQIVQLIDVLRPITPDDATVCVIYELAKWERKHVGGRLQARVRLPRPGRNS